MNDESRFDNLNPEERVYVNKLLAEQIKSGGKITAEAEKHIRANTFKNLSTTIYDVKLTDKQLRAQIDTLPEGLQKHLLFEGFFKPEAPKAVEVTPAELPKKRSVADMFLYGIVRVFVIWPTKALIGLLKLFRREAKPVEKPAVLVAALKDLTDKLDALDEREFDATFDAFEHKMTETRLHEDDQFMGHAEQIKTIKDAKEKDPEAASILANEQAVAQLSNNLSTLQRENEELKKQLAALQSKENV